MGKLRGERDIEAAIHRLDRLANDEGLATAAQTLEVVYGLVKHRRAIMDSEYLFRFPWPSAKCSYFAPRLGHRHVCIGNRYLASSEYVSYWLAIIGVNNI
jgi:hypothetical protein